jgi:hypothetical protein
MVCENCNKDHDGKYGTGRFCSVKCARGFSTKNKRAEINEKVSTKLIGRKLTDEHKKNLEVSNNFNRKEKNIRHCLGCGIEISCRPSEKKKFCSLSCWGSYTERNKEPYLLYRQQANFTFDVKDYPDKFDLTILEQNGWYSPSNKGNNLNGVSKDHMLSVKDGFEMGINPEIIKHPANCKLVLHKENQRKHRRSSITFEELKERIKHW